MYNIQYVYVKPKYGNKLKFRYLDTGNLTVYIQSDEIYKDIAEYIEVRFDTSNYEVDRPLPKAKNKKVIGFMKDELAKNARSFI